MWITIAQFLLSLSILVVLHECGHFFTAKWFKTKVEKFYLFFNPYFSLFKVQYGETEYGIGWLPLGGYVKIAGMIDESFDKEQMEGPPQPWEFRSKPAWQRLIIMLGGVIVNFILGVVIFAGLLWSYGDSYITNDSLTYGIHVDALGESLGLRDGDKLMKVGDEAVVKFPSSIITREIAINNARTITVNRGGAEKVLQINDEQAATLTAHENKDAKIYEPRMPPTIGTVKKGSAAEEGGIIAGDRLMGINGVTTPYINEFNSAKAATGTNTFEVEVMREGRMLPLIINTKDDKAFGVVFQNYDEHFEVKKTKYSLLASIPAATKKSINFIDVQIKAFSQMFRGKIKAKDSLGSFITIGKMFGTDWDWERFWTMTASLSLLLGFLNLLPIPALDGGHVMFLLWESITGVKPSDKVIEYSTMAGFIFLIILMVYAMGLDISRLF